MSQKKFSGVLVPALTPFNADLSPNKTAFVEHCRWLLEEGADGLAVFGTTSEANSLTLEERIELLEALIENGISAELLMPGTGACAIGDSIRLTNHAVNLGCGGCLMLPPYYYKGVSDDGLFAAFSEVIQKVSSDRLKIYLYHIPPVAQVPISLDLIGRLIRQYPDTVVGLKDSSGDWSNTEAVIKEFPEFETFAGSEVFLLDTLRAGGVGCITATGNVNPAGIRSVYEKWRTDRADELQARITEVRKTIQNFTMIPALKVMIADYSGQSHWKLVRPPLMQLASDQVGQLRSDLQSIDFSLQGRRETITV